MDKKNREKLNVMDEIVQYFKFVGPDSNGHYINGEYNIYEYCKQGWHFVFDLNSNTLTMDSVGFNTVEMSIASASIMIERIHSVLMREPEV